jgi:hypothetical protein
MTFSDSGPEKALPSLLERELKEALPSFDWLVLGEEMPPTRDLHARVAARVEQHEAAVVVLAVSASYFTYDYVAARVRRRWPWLYGLTRTSGDRMRSAAGGGHEGRGTFAWVYRLPRRLAEFVIGAEPYMKVEHAVANTAAALSYLSAKHGLVAMMRLPFVAEDLPRHAVARYRRRLEESQAPIKALCASHAMHCYDLSEVMRTDGRVATRVADGLHSDYSARAWEAAYLAREIAVAVTVQAGPRVRQATRHLAPRAPP